MTGRQQIEEAIDAVREDRTFTPLRAIIGAFARSCTALTQDELDDIVGDCARTIVEQIKKGVITPSIASQLGTIVRNRVVSEKRKQRTVERRRADVDPDEVDGAGRTTDPLALIADYESFQDLVNDLSAVRLESERYFVVLMALVHGESVTERLERRFGKTVSKNTEYKLVERARKKLDSIISKRKEGIL